MFDNSLNSPSTVYHVLLVFALFIYFLVLIAAIKCSMYGYVVTSKLLLSLLPQ